MNDDHSKLKASFINDFNLPLEYDEFGWWKPSLRGREKMKWGFHHPQIAKLLCPFLEDPSDAKSVVSLVDCC